mmetsp:Transcript_73054/g.144862  ORF Transcript_73054/g.144862 Transcript_73054/m.144862 type:complete len:129 (+) Transcript_73054:74-460(+)
MEERHKYFWGALAGGFAGAFTLRINGRTIWSILDTWSNEPVPMAPVAAVGVVGAATSQAASKAELQESSLVSIELVALIAAFSSLCLAYSYLRWGSRQERVEQVTNNVKTGKHAKDAKKGRRRSSNTS